MEQMVMLKLKLKQSVEISAGTKRIHARAKSGHLAVQTLLYTQQPISCFA